MNLAIKDIRYHLFKFISSTVGVGLILMVVLTIGGIIRGIILDSSTIIDATGADLWVVQKDWLGPFVEISRLPEDYYHAIQSMHGVDEVSPLVMAWDHIERPMRPTPLMKFMYMNTVIGTRTMVQPGWMDMPHDLRFIVIGYEPGHLGGPPVIVAGRGIEASHYEIVADVKTGLEPGEHIRLGDFDYTVVGLTKNIVGYTADPVIYATLNDAQNILLEADPDLLRNIRRRTQQQLLSAATLDPRLSGPLANHASQIAENVSFVNAVAVKVQPGVSVEMVAREIARWKHLTVYTSAREVNMQLMGSNRLILLQLSLFRLILLIIAGVVIGLITYTFTLDKLKEIAVLKLLGTQTRRIYSMILQQAVLMGLLGTLLGAALEFASEPYFPRRVVATRGDVVQMLIVISVIAFLASIMAIPAGHESRPAQRARHIRRRTDGVRDSSEGPV
ncbi:MAG TPA: ABC transporter permease [Candidatus Acidoferrales bacterium]|nr:ABC transporter permease [Candidatus Acidoferrales bacterium]